MHNLCESSKAQKFNTLTAAISHHSRKEKFSAKNLTGFHLSKMSSFSVPVPRGARPHDQSACDDAAGHGVTRAQPQSPQTAPVLQLLS